jgi:hypothetical protein
VSVISQNILILYAYLTESVFQINKNIYGMEEGEGERK